MWIPVKAFNGEKFSENQPKPKNLYPKWAGVNKNERTKERLNEIFVMWSVPGTGSAILTEHKTVILTEIERIWIFANLSGSMHERSREKDLI